MGHASGTPVPLGSASALMWSDFNDGTWAATLIRDEVNTDCLMTAKLARVTRCPMPASQLPQTTGYSQDQARAESHGECLARQILAEPVRG